MWFARYEWADLGDLAGKDVLHPQCDLGTETAAFAARGARRRAGTHPYTDGPDLARATEVYEWAHGLGEVVNALLGAGLRITSLRESDEIPWPRWPSMAPAGDGFWRLPDTEPRIPLFYALAARA